MMDGLEGGRVRIWSDLSGFPPGGESLAAKSDLMESIVYFLS